MLPSIPNIYSFLALYPQEYGPCTASLHAVLQQTVIRLRFTWQGTNACSVSQPTNLLYSLFLIVLVLEPWLRDLKVDKEPVLKN